MVGVGGSNPLAPTNFYIGSGIDLSGSTNVPETYLIVSVTPQRGESSTAWMQEVEQCRSNVGAIAEDARNNLLAPFTFSQILETKFKIF